jgi:hypothetical protein
MTLTGSSERRIMFSMLLFTATTYACAAHISLGASATDDSLCRNTNSLRICRLCGDIFGEFQTSECCSDQVLNSLCQSFINSVRANDKRYLKKSTRQPYQEFAAKKSRNTFLGKRSSLDDFDRADFEYRMEMSDEPEGVMDGKFGMAADKRNRNNFLGKRVARSAVSNPRVSRDRIAKLIESFVDQLAVELMMKQSRGAVRDDNNSTSETESRKASALFWSKPHGERSLMEREQRARNTFLGKRDQI